MIILLSIALLISFYLLAKVCDDYFVESLDKISNRLKLSHDAAGATLMAMGSSAPELFVSIMALIKPGDHASLGMGTIIGSALFNILVIIGISAVVRKTIVSWQPVVRDCIFYSLSIILLLFAFRDGKIELIESIYFIGTYILYIVAVVNWQKILPHKTEDHQLEPETEKKAEGSLPLWKGIFKPFDWLLSKCFPNEKHFYWIFFISITIIAGLSWVLVESAVEIATILNIPPVIIALTILAAGTSVPDLISSVIVAKQGRGGMAISNAIGSNIFDILFGLGMPWLVILLFQKSSISVSTENLFSSIILLFATVLVIFFLLFIRKWKIGKYAGYFLVTLYLVYLGWTISQAI